MADASQQPQGVVFSPELAAVLVKMAREYVAANGQGAAPRRRPAQRPRTNANLELAVLVDAIPRGADGIVTLKRGRTKGSESDSKTVRAFNRQFADLPAEAEVFLSFQGGGWEIVQVVSDECGSLSDPTAIAGYVEGEELVLGINEEGCWCFFELGDC